MTAILNALVEASFHVSDDRQTLFRLYGPWGRETYLVNNPRRTKKLRRLLTLWYAAATAYLTTFVLFVLASPYLRSSYGGDEFDESIFLIYFIMFFPLLVSSFSIAPRDLLLASVMITDQQMVEKFLASLSAFQIIWRLVIYLPVAIISRYTVVAGLFTYDARVFIDLLSWVTTILASFLLVCLIAKLSRT